MRRSAAVAVSSCFLFLVACQDAPVAPTGDGLGSATFAKGGKPGKPGKPGDDPPPPPPPPADPALLYSTHVGGKPRRNRPSLGWSIHVMNPDGTNQTRVLADGEELGFESITPHFSPDGTQFVYNRDAGDITIANIDGSGLTTVHASSEWRPYPRWSPVPLGDGRFKIVGSGVSTSGDDLFVVNLDGSGFTQLTNTPADWYYFDGAVWSPAADRLLTVYFDDPVVQYRVQLLGITCAQACQITSTVEIDLSAWLTANDAFIPRDWSNAGNRIVGSVLFGGSGPAEIGVLDITNPANPVFIQLTATTGLDESHPTWSPDDSQIAYTGYPVNGDRSAFVMNADGTGSQVIAEVGNEWGMDWRPTP